MPFRIGPFELIIILLILILVFGAGRLSGIGGALGKSIRDFKKGLQDEGEDKATKDKAAEEPKE